MKVYFDTIAINKATDTCPEDRLNVYFRKNGIELCLESHVIYEIARCFLDNNKDRGKKLFGYLLALDQISFLRPTDELIRSDLDFALTGGKEIAFLDRLNTVATREELTRMSLGYIDRAKEFVAKREKDLSRDTPKFREQILESNKGKKIDISYEETRDNWSHRRQILDGKYAEESKYLSDELLFSYPQKYPILNTWINVNIYCNYVALSKPKAPSKKSSSDYRHLISASATDLFVTSDKTLLNNTSKLSPYSRTTSCEDFLKF